MPSNYVSGCLVRNAPKNQTLSVFCVLSCCWHLASLENVGVQISAILANRELWPHEGNVSKVLTSRKVRNENPFLTASHWTWNSIVALGFSTNFVPLSHLHQRTMLTQETHAWCHVLSHPSTSRVSYMVSWLVIPCVVSPVVPRATPCIVRFGNV